MKLITRNSDYAIRAVAYMAGKDKLISVSEFSREIKAPRPFMRKILQILSRRGIVKSSKGVRGGFRLSVPLDRIRVADIVAAFQGPMKIDDCYLAKALCPQRPFCPIKKRIDRIEKFIMSELGSVKIDDLISGGRIV